ncbi:MAG: hypothetical protein NLN65_03050 [Candidatus Poseidoniaceae archaeon]|nr:hypothetical protein [Candidatus Poseidoniaceae archaeon]|tara:strand:+ start:4562 stop:4783 length:222 start_codon:yes stop_codon:yes gene_type:complete
MSELHEATIEWTGEAKLAPLFLAAAQHSECEVSSLEKNGEVHLTVKIQHSSLQSLRDIVDALLINFADIEEAV